VRFQIGIARDAGARLRFGEDLAHFGAAQS
jgi:hypothetical protein